MQHRVESLLIRHHERLARAALGGGFAFGFLYTAKTGTSPVSDALGWTDRGGGVARATSRAGSA